MKTKVLTVIAAAIICLLSGCGTTSTDLYKKGEAAYEEKNYADAVKWYKMAAEQGYVKAQYILGNCYENGEGVEKDSGEAIKWYKKAAEQGFLPAKERLQELVK